MKKRLACAMILFTIVFSLVPTALAAETVTYDLSPLDISVDLPADWAVITQTNCDEEICQKYFYMSAEEMKADFSEYNEYLDSVDKNDTDREIYILIDELSGTDYNDLSEKELDAEAEFHIEYFSDETFTGHSIYKNDNITYLTYDSSDSGTYYKEYITMHDGYRICFIATCYSGAIGADFTQVLKGAVDSTIFTADVAAAKAVALEAKIIVAVAILVLTGVVYLLLKSRGKRKAKVQNGYNATAQNTYYNPQPFQPQPFQTQPQQAQSSPVWPAPIQPAPAAHISSQPVYTSPAAPQPIQMGVTPAQTAPASSNDIPEKLSLLKELFDSGIITEEEYAAKKAQLLEKL